MSKLDWHEFASAVGAAVIVVSIVAWSGLANLPAIERRAAEHAEQAAQQERRAIEALLLDQHEQAVTAETRARRQAERERSDLEAQWATARWTLAQFIVGIVSLIGLAFTVWFSRHAWLQSRESAIQARRAANIAQKQLIDARVASAASQEIGEGTTRAYVHIVGAEYQPPLVLNEVTRNARPEGVIRLKFENFGGTVAKNVVVRFEIVIENAAGVLRYRDLDEWKQLPLPNIAPNQTPPVETEAAVDPNVFVTWIANIPDPYGTIRAEVRYSDVYGKRYRTSAILWTLRTVRDAAKVFPMELVRVRMPAFQRIEPDEYDGSD